MERANRKTATQQSADVSALSIDPAEMVAQIEALDTPYEHGDEWMTAEQWRVFWQVGRRKTHDLLRAALESGKMEVKRIAVRRVDGQQQSYPHYRWVG